MSRSLAFRLFVLALALALSPATAWAQWTLDGIAVSTAASNQQVPAIASDGGGGGIIAWHDFRAGNYDIYAQRVNVFGAPQWAANGVPLCTSSNEQAFPAIIPDGAGGAFVTWHDARSGNFDIYVQRVNATGAPQWTANGVALCVAANEQSFPKIVSDGGGGAIVTWQDFRSGNWDVYAQRVNGAGVVQWTINGVALTTASGHQQHPSIIDGNAGSAIVAWEDTRWGGYDIYGQRVSSAGALLWTTTGVWVCVAAGDQLGPSMVPDGAGGVIVTWADSRSPGIGIYAQRMNQAGGPQWEYALALDGVPLCSVATDVQRPAIISDGVGGAIATWTDLRNTAGAKVYVQRINPSGVPQWATNGVALGTASPGASEYLPVIAPDGTGGALVAWQDNRSGTNIYAQRVNSSGAVQWATGGVALCSSAGEQGEQVIVAGSSGNALVAWKDLRSGSSYDIYAQRVESHGFWGYPEPFITSVADIPLDQGGRVQVTWNASQWDASGFNTINYYSLWREVSAFASLAAPPSFEIDPSRIVPGFEGRVHRTVAGPEGTLSTWEFIATVPVRFAAQYAYTATTLADSVPGNFADETYQVLAHNNSPFLFFESNTLAGHSVDNLAPSAPVFVSAQRVGADVQLKWSRVGVQDLRDYAVYRSSSPGVTPVPSSFLGSASDTALVDAGAPGGSLYYIVTAYDVHANQSAASNEVTAAPTASVGDVAAIAVLTVLPNTPNPFQRNTHLRLGLPRPSNVSVEVYDLAGRRVAQHVWENVGAGWQRLTFEAMDERSRRLATGVYAYRVTAAGTTCRGRMIVLE